MIIRGITRLKERWNAPFGYKEILKLALPLIITTGSWSITQFIDRVFLTWYSPEAIAAAMPSGMLNFTMVCVFIGTINYVTVFVAQYFGSKNYKMIGAVMWQGLYLALFGALILLPFIPAAGAIFNFIGHEPEVRELQIVYFQIMTVGAFTVLCSCSLSSFFSGIGKPYIVMWTNVGMLVFNVIANYILIFGRFGFPEMGIKGAAISSVISSVLNFVIYFAIIFKKDYRLKYNSLSAWRFNPKLIYRLLKFGLPNGFQFLLDMIGMTIFIFLVGRMGTSSLAATNIAFNIGNFSFMPMIGLGIAVSILVGRSIGAKNIKNAEFCTYSGFQMTGLYMLTIALLFVFVPKIFIMPFAANVDMADYQDMFTQAAILLRFVAFYCLFDTMNIIFASAIKGAGDTRFVVLVLGLATVLFMIIPSYFAFFVFKLSLLGVWVIPTLYVVVLGIIFWLRFRNGAWKRMSVIEGS